MKQCGFYLLLVMMLSGCLANEAPCTYFRLAEKELYNHVWKIDSFRIHVADSAAQYFFDTVYTNYGECRFIPENPYRCNYTGLLNLTLQDGTNHQLTYDFTRWVYGDGICLGSNDHLDGLAKPYYGCTCFVMGDTIRFGSGCGFWPGTSPYRIWRFVLSKK